jgi:hypothetical protein
MKHFKLLGGILAVIIGCVFFCAAQQPQPSPAQTKQAQTVALAEFKEEFDGTALDSKKWEQYSLEGGGTIKVAKGKLMTSGASGSRFGIRSVQTFKTDKFVVSAKVASVAAALSEASGTPTGNAVLVVLFDNNGVNRLEWIVNTDGRFEAWLMRDGRSERLDDKNLGTKEKSPTLGIARRGDDYFFMLNGEVGMQKKIKNLPAPFRVMLYGFGTSKDEWEMVSIITPEQK